MNTITSETFKLLVRRILTVVGTLLIAFKVGDETETGKLIDSIADGAGACFVLADLLWAFFRVWQREKSASVIKVEKIVYPMFAAVLLICAGCKTLPDGTQQIDSARVARIAGVAAYIGASVDLVKHSANRPAYEMAVAELKSLESSTNYDAAALAQALSGLGIREFQGPEGALYVQSALLVWDEALKYTAPVTEVELVRLTIPQIRSGLERALASTASRAK